MMLFCSGGISIRKATYFVMMYCTARTDLPIVFVKESKSGIDVTDNSGDAGESSNRSLSVNWFTESRFSLTTYVLGFCFFGVHNQSYFFS